MHFAMNQQLLCTLFSQSNSTKYDSLSNKCALTGMVLLEALYVYVMLRVLSLLLPQVVALFQIHQLSWKSLSLEKDPGLARRAHGSTAQCIALVPRPSGLWTDQDPAIVVESSQRCGGKVRAREREHF